MAEFDPRQAALQYAANVERMGDDPPASDAIHAVVCGLVYVGDQIGELAHCLDNALPTAGRGN